MLESKFSHVDLVCTSLERSLAFYRGLLAPLGWNREGQIVGERGEEVHYLNAPKGLPRNRRPIEHLNDSLREGGAAPGRGQQQE